MRTIHPFPARMAPELALAPLSALPKSAVVLDPMCGSGTTLRIAAEQGLRAIGCDIDPLAQKIARVWCTKFSKEELEHALDLAQRFSINLFNYEDFKCKETQRFIDFWYLEEQKQHLNKISQYLLSLNKSAVRDLLMVALSKTIITKFRGASVAWDVSHSRPHRKKTENDYDVVNGFNLAVKSLVNYHQSHSLACSATVYHGDCRNISIDEEADLILTSPPYLNAIDYMRGHRLALVWLGYTLPELRSIRSSSIGSEITLKANEDEIKEYANLALGTEKLPSPQDRIFLKYVHDSKKMMSAMNTRLKTDGKLILVVANSALKGIQVSHNKMFASIAESVGLKLISDKTREIPANRRYLPATSKNGALEKRMKTEHILEFQAIS